MNPRRRIRLIVKLDGSVSAKTENIFGEDCLSKINVLENMLEALTVDSRFTEDFTKIRNQSDLTISRDQETSA